MYLLEQPAYADRLITRLQTIPTQLLEGLQPSGPNLELKHTDDLCAELPAQQLFIIETGLLHALIDGKPLFYLQEGDLVGLRQSSDLPECRYCSDEPISLVPYSRNAVFQHIHADEQRQELFTQYLIGHTALLGDALARLKQPEIPATGFKHFAVGEEPFARATKRTMYSSSSKATPKPSSTDKRLATYRRTRSSGPWRCSPASGAAQPWSPASHALSWSFLGEQFLGLTQSNPRIAHSLIESMARRIDLLNKEVTHLRVKRRRLAIRSSRPRTYILRMPVDAEMRIVIIIATDREVSR